MKKILLAAFIFLFSVPGVHAQDENVSSSGHVDVSKAWSRATNGKSGAIFLTLTGPTKNALVKASSPVAKTVELHTHIKEGNVMRMRKVEKFDITPAQETVLKPGGDHIMLIDLQTPLKEKDEIPLELTFEDGSIINLQVPVRKAGAIKPCGCTGGK